LALDEAAIEEKDRRDREKLKALVEMCYSRTCRQRWILTYFGEAGGGNCGNCDVCREEGAAESRALTAEEKLVVRKALSGVARMSRRTADGWEARYGRGRIVQMLAGSRSQEVLSAGLDRLTTYGMLKEQGAGFLNGLMRSLGDAGLVQTVTGEYPLLTLTPLGDRVMRGETECSLVWPEAGGARKEVELQDHGFDAVLYSMLRDLRTKIAKRDKLPTYVVFNNKTLEGLARFRPKTVADALLVPGVGAAKAERYLPPFLKLLAEWGRR
jgi:ATP-dependent DNA helicase RecQ